MSTTADKIKSCIEQLTKLESAKKHFEILTASIQTMKQELSDKTMELSKELDDIEKLERINVTSLFHKVLGNKEEQLEKERQEYLTLAMKIKELKQTLELSEYEASIVEKKAMNSEALKMELESLKKQREQEILSDHSESARPALLQTVSDIDQLHKFRAELNEAQIEGEKARNTVSEVSQFLTEAIRHGEWDMATNNTFHDHNKHRALDRATNAVYRTQQALQLFNKELYDVGMSDDSLSFDSETFSKFPDFFLDNLISDWIMQRKIKNSLSISQSLQYRIEYLIEKVQKEDAACNTRINDLLGVKEAIIMNNSL